MVHGEEKARDMARSLLPSRWRKGARKERALIHRGSRRKPKEALARLTREPEGWEELPSPKDFSRRELLGVVQHRRGADKVNPFIRWATAVTREFPRESRLSHVRGRVPRGVIGEHALVHLKHTAAFEDPVEREWRWAWWLRNGGSSRTGWMNRGEHAQLLRQVLQVPEGHRTFNRWLRCHPATYDRWGNRVWSKPVRTLLGLHDVLPFLDTVGHITQGRDGRQWWGPANPQADIFQVMDRFLRAFKQCRGDVEATLAKLGVRAGRRDEPPFVKLKADQRA
jgi:hypothetical protein